MNYKIKYLLIFGIVMFSFYLYKLHSLAVENNKIFEQRCLKVNPPLISYKNAFLKYADYLNNPTDEKLKNIESYFNGYVEGMRNYVKEENDWLFLNETYINSWGFKLLEPQYMKEVAGYQHEMYKGYRDEALRMLELIDGQRKSEEFSEMFQEARDRRMKYENLYFENFDKAVLIKDWRKLFGRVPVPEGCTEENMDIPDTSGSINWDGPTPTPVIIDPDKVS